jgi:hypothetical protein
MSFVTKESLVPVFNNARVAIVCSGPSCLNNKGQDIDDYDVVVRVNNYKIKGFEDKVGTRTDVYYSFFGGSIKKTAEELRADGTYLCMCKCPNEKVVDHDKMVDWDEKNTGGDFRPIYRRRENFWFCRTYIPELRDFQKQMKLLDGHIPTTGFSAILTIMGFLPKELYITGFDGFKSGIHNVDEKWNDKSGRIDPICHEPAKELKLLQEFKKEYNIIHES